LASYQLATSRKNGQTGNYLLRRIIRSNAAIKPSSKVALTFRTVSLNRSDCALPLGLDFDFFFGFGFGFGFAFRPLGLCVIRPILGWSFGK
jgi:hypothetical protein